MTNTEIIYSALGSPEVKCENISGNCLICGKNIEQGVKMKEVLSGNFTNWGECKSRTSQYICKECTAAIKEKA